MGDKSKLENNENSEKNHTFPLLTKLRSKSIIDEKCKKESDNINNINLSKNISELKNFGKIFVNKMDHKESEIKMNNSGNTPLINSDSSKDKLFDSYSKISPEFKLNQTDDKLETNKLLADFNVSGNSSVNRNLLKDVLNFIDRKNIIFFIFIF